MLHRAQAHHAFLLDELSQIHKKYIVYIHATHTIVMDVSKYFNEGRVRS